MVDEVIETKDGLKLRKLVELKTSTAEEYQEAMLDRVEYFKKQNQQKSIFNSTIQNTCLLYTSPSPRDRTRSRMPSSA